MTAFATWVGCGGDTPAAELGLRLGTAVLATTRREKIYRIDG